MGKVLVYSALLLVGLVGSQVLPALIGPSYASLAYGVNWATLFCLAFIMIHVGYEFTIDKTNLPSYAWDGVVATTAAVFPWVFCALYFVFVLSSPETWGSGQLWKESVLVSLFASPTSAGVLFSMLAAAGLSATWLFRKARVLAIFDDLAVILLMIPLKMMMVGLKWQLGIVVLIMAGLLAVAWRYLHTWKVPTSWPWVMAYGAAITAACEAIYHASKLISDVVTIHIEVLLPAFVMGCVMAVPAGHDPHVDDSREGHQEGPETANEQRIAAIVSGAFMVLVGLSMPVVIGGANAPTSGWGIVALHVLAITVVSNAGKLFPALCYRRETNWRERLALGVGMFPRGEVGAGVLVTSLSYGIGGISLTVGMLSLALNLVLTGVFVVAVKKLIDVPHAAA